MADALLAEARVAVHERVLIDGIRQRETLVALRRLAGGLSIAILFVHTTPDLAYTFYHHRQDQTVTLDEFMRLRGADVESEVDELIGESDAVLYNWTGRAKYRNVVRRLMESLGVEMSS